MQDGENENDRLLFLGVGIALGRSGQLKAGYILDFLIKIGVSERDFFDVFPSFDAYLDDVLSLEKRVESEKGDS